MVVSSNVYSLSLHDALPIFKIHVPDEIQVHPHVLHGTIYDEILRAADKLGVEVIVIGSHRPELKDYLLGPNAARVVRDRKSTRLNSSHVRISYAVFCLKKKR